MNDPTFTEVGYIEVFDYDEANKEFNLRWKDDFNGFIDSRWKKGNDNKTWPGNRSL